MDIGKWSLEVSTRSPNPPRNESANKSSSNLDDDVNKALKDGGSFLLPDHKSEGYGRVDMTAAKGRTENDGDKHARVRDEDPGVASNAPSLQHTESKDDHGEELKDEKVESLEMVGDGVDAALSLVIDGIVEAPASEDGDLFTHSDQCQQTYYSE